MAQKRKSTTSKKFLTKKEFSIVANINPKHLSTYAKRGHIEVSSNGKVDITNPTNEKFVYLRTSPEEKKNKKLKSENIKSLQEQIKKKKILDNEKIIEEIALLKIKKEKLASSQIPTEMANSLIDAHSENIKSELTKTVNKIMNKFSKSGLGKNDLANYKKTAINELNYNSHTILNTSKKEIESIADEFSEVRTVGEHD